MKKKYLLAAGILGTTLLAAACGNSEATTATAAAETTGQAASEAETTMADEASDAKESSSLSSMEVTSTSMILSTFALNQDIVESVVMAPFESQYGLDVTLDVGTASERLTKLLGGAAGAVDAVELSQNNAASGKKEGIFLEITKEDVPNIAHLTEGAMEIFEAGLGVPYAVNSVGIVYNPEGIGRELTGWEDLWSEDLAGKIAIPDISTTFGPAVLYIASDYAGVPIESDKGEAAFGALAELSPNIVKTYSKSSDLANMFQSGEIEAAILADFAYGIVSAAAPEAVYFVPESGTYANYNTINVLADAQHKDAALAYINWRISKDLELLTAEAFNEAPVNKEVMLSEEVAAYKTYGDIAARAKNTDTAFINENLEDWVGRWNEIVNQ